MKVSASRARFVSLVLTLERKTCKGRLHGELSLQIWVHNMISKLRPASRAHFVSFGNVAKQDVIRASTWGFEPRGLPSADVGCLLPTGASEGSGVPSAHVGCLKSLTCRRGSGGLHGLGM